MRDHIVLDVFGSQVSLECGSYGHDGPPLRLTSLASLALTTPREERGREICRIAVTYRRAGRFFWGVRGRPPPPPLKKAGGQAARPEKDKPHDEERRGNEHPQDPNTK